MRKFVSKSSSNKNDLIPSLSRGFSWLVVVEEKQLLRNSISGETLLIRIGRGLRDTNYLRHWDFEWWRNFETNNFATPPLSVDLKVMEGEEEEDKESCWQKTLLIAKL